MTQTYVLRDTGTQPTNNVAITLTAASVFSFPTRANSDCINGMPLAAGSSCTVRVTFGPTVAGSFQTVLQATASPLGGTVLLNLQGVGLAPPPLTLAPDPASSTSLGFYIVGRPATEEFHVLTNTGGFSTDTINLSFVADTSMGGFRFSQTVAGDCPIDTVTDPQTVSLLPLAPGRACNVLVLFSSTTPNSFSAILVADDTTPPPTTAPGHASLTLGVHVVFQ